MRPTLVSLHERRSSTAPGGRGCARDNANCAGAFSRHLLLGARASASE